MPERKRLGHSRQQLKAGGGRWGSGCCRLVGGGDWCLRGVVGVAQRQGQLGSLFDRVFGVEFDRPICATNEMHSATGSDQSVLQFALRFLPCTHHHRVRRNCYVLVSHRDVQTGVVDATVSDAVEHLNRAIFERCPVDPAGGFAQALADFSGLALQEVNLTGTRFDMGRLQSACRRILGVHAPFSEKPGLVQAGARAFVQQVFRHIKPNPASTD